MGAVFARAPISYGVWNCRVVVALRVAGKASSGADIGGSCGLPGTQRGVERDALDTLARVRWIDLVSCAAVGRRHTCNAWNAACTNIRRIVSEIGGTADRAGLTVRTNAD